MNSRSNDVIVVQSAVLVELTDDVRQDGLDDVVAVLDSVVARLDQADPPYDRVRSVIADLEMAYHRLLESALTDAQRDQAASLQAIQKRLQRTVDLDLTETQPIDIDEVFPLRRRDPPRKS